MYAPHVVGAQRVVNISLFHTLHTYPMCLAILITFTGVLPLVLVLILRPSRLSLYLPLANG